jgi:hypothetical protein
LRIERAFLLEQLAKRTSANVEDSDGSPSPPPTVCSHFLLPLPLLAWQSFLSGLPRLCSSRRPVQC